MSLRSDPASPVRLTPIQRLAMGGRWRVEAMRAFREPVLYWFTQGQGRFTLSGVTRGYGAHNAIFLPPGIMHGFEMTSRVHGTLLHLGRDHGIELPSGPLHLRVRDVTSQTEIAGILDAIQRELDGGQPGRERAARHHLGLLGVWLDRQMARTEGEPVPPPDAARRLAARYARLLERQFDAGVRIADFAAALGVTPTHLTRACRAANGRSAHDLLQERVFFEARRLLAETSMPVKDVARHLGFRSAAYFTRAFSAAAGQTPSGFRDEARRRAAAAAAPPGRTPAIGAGGPSGAGRAVGLAGGRWAPSASAAGLSRPLRPGFPIPPPLRPREG